MFLILYLRGKHVWKLNLHSRVGQDYKKIYIYFLYGLSFVLLLSFFCPERVCSSFPASTRVCRLVSACTLIRQAWCRNSELWKGQKVTFVCDFCAEMKHDVSCSEWITRTHPCTIASARQITMSLWFWPLFSDPALLWEMQAEKFFILFFRRSQQFVFPLLHSH